MIRTQIVPFLVLLACVPVAAQPKATDKPRVSAHRRLDALIELATKEAGTLKDDCQRGCAYWEIAFALLDRGRTNEALKLADKREYAYWMIYLRATERLVSAGRYDAAWSVVDKLEASHWKIDALLRIAKACASAGEKDKAQTALERAYKLATAGKISSWLTLARIGELYAAAGNRKRAVEAFAAARKAHESAHKHGKGSFQARRRLIEFEATAGFVDEAIRNAGERDSWALCQIGIMLASKGKDEQALKAVNKCVPWHAVHALTRIAVIQARAGRKAQSSAALKEAKARVGKLTGAKQQNQKWIEIAFAYVAIGELDRADELLNKSDVPATRWVELAILIASRDKDRAKGYVHKAIAALPNIGGPYNACLAMLSIAQAQASLGLADKAQATLRKAVEVAVKESRNGPNGPYNACLAMLSIAQAQASLGLADKAQATLRKAVEFAVKESGNGPKGQRKMNPIIILMWIARQQSTMGDKKAAVRTFSLAVEFSGASHVRLREAVRITAQLGLYDLAVQTAGKIAPSSPRQAAYQDVARSQGAKGLEDAALAWIVKLTDVSERAFAISGLTAGLRNRQEKNKPGRKTAEKTE